MPSSHLPGFSATHPSFLQHRYYEDFQAPPLKINLAVPAPVPAWASLPTPPMSGTPSPDFPSDSTQSAGRRRKREDTPPSSLHTTTQPGTTSLNVSPLVEQTAQRYGEGPRTTMSSDHVVMPHSLTMPWEQHQSYGPGGGTGYLQYVPAPLPTRQLQVSPRATRKTKAHVASACVNCKRKHLRCDESRPCRRCVQSGKEDTCVDVEHKKRGRPPLKPDDSNTSGRFGNIGSGISLPPLGPAPPRMGGPTLPPLLPTPTPSRVPYSASYAPSTISQTPAFAQGRFTHSHQPQSFPSARTQAPNMSQNSAPGHVPTYCYVDQASSNNAFAPQDYPGSMFPRGPIPSQPSMSRSSGDYSAPQLQLPPILPAPPNTNVNSAIAQQQKHFQPRASPYSMQSPGSRNLNPHVYSTLEDRDTKRPRMDIRGILGPRE